MAVITMHVWQEINKDTPFCYKFNGSDIIGWSSIEILPDGVRISSNDTRSTYSCTLSYEQFSKWFAEHRRTSTESGTVNIQSGLDSKGSGNSMTWVKANPSSPYNQIRIGSVSVVAGHMNYLEPFIQVLRFANRMPKFLSMQTEMETLKVEFYEEQFGTIEELSCPRCNNPYEDDKKDCIYCRECVACGATCLEDICQVCGQENN